MISDLWSSTQFSIDPRSNTQVLDRLRAVRGVERIGVLVISMDDVVDTMIALALVRP